MSPTETLAGALRAHARVACSLSVDLSTDPGGQYTGVKIPFEHVQSESTSRWLGIAPAPAPCPR